MTFMAFCLLLVFIDSTASTISSKIQSVSTKGVGTKFEPKSESFVRRCNYKTHRIFQWTIQLIITLVS